MAPAMNMMENVIVIQDGEEKIAKNNVKMAHTD